MSSEVRVRFAPSPTGYLHIGGARTALFNWLYAKHTGGTFVLRIEDTDKARNTEEAVRVIYEGLRWLGLNWDEGPEVGGAYGPYMQSQRDSIYESYLKKLQDAGQVYEEAGAIRFRSPRTPVIVDDLVCGSIEFDRSNDPDMTIRRPDGSWIFHFVSVVDDIEMRISHVIRGEDHLSNTPKHLELYRAFGATPPKFAHIPLILNRDGSKMSKRDQGASISSYIEKGYAPEAVVNYLCLLGWSPKDNREKMDIGDVIRLFELEKLNRRNAAFDMDKLQWLNGEYLREMDKNRYKSLALESLKRSALSLNDFPEQYIEAAVGTTQGKVKTLSELEAYAGFYFKKEITIDPEAAAKQFVPENKIYLEKMFEAYSTLPAFDAASLETALKEAAKDLGVKAGALVHPTRLACTGGSSGPSLYHLLEILGRETVLARISQALQRF